jgi:hypothetical protein
VLRQGGTTLTYNQMVVRELTDETVDHLFHALADATRRDILRRSVRGDLSVSRLADACPMSFAAVQKLTSLDKYLDNLSLTLVADFDAPIERVWQLWADPRQLERWWGRRALPPPCSDTT